MACRERELMQAMGDNECIHAMLGGVKLSMPGMQRALQAQKKAKKRS